MRLDNLRAPLPGALLSTTMIAAMAAVPAVASSDTQSPQPAPPTAAPATATPVATKASSSLTVDSVRRTVTLTLDGVDAADALRRLSDAPALLEGERWHVFTPPTGMPRVTADRSGDLGDEHLLTGCAIERARLFLRLTSTGIPVGRAGVHALLGAAA